MDFLGLKVAMQGVSLPYTLGIGAEGANQNCPG